MRLPALWIKGRTDDGDTRCSNLNTVARVGWDHPPESKNPQRGVRDASVPERTKAQRMALAGGGEDRGEERGVGPFAGGLFQLAFVVTSSRHPEIATEESAGFSDTNAPAPEVYGLHPERRGDVKSIVDDQGNTRELIPQQPPPAQKLLGACSRDANLHRERARGESLVQLSKRVDPAFFCGQCQIGQDTKRTQANLDVGRR